MVREDRGEGVVIRTLHTWGAAPAAPRFSRQFIRPPVVGDLPPCRGVRKDVIRGDRNRARNIATSAAEDHLGNLSGSCAARASVLERRGRLPDGNRGLRTHAQGTGGGSTGPLPSPDLSRR